MLLASSSIIHCGAVRHFGRSLCVLWRLLSCKTCVAGCNPSAAECHMSHVRAPGTGGTAVNEARIRVCAGLCQAQPNSSGTALCSITELLMPDAHHHCSKLPLKCLSSLKQTHLLSTTGSIAFAAAKSACPCNNKSLN
jgi:hypothetical protein